MRNRAKCKLCGDTIESFHQHDYVKCKCEEIGIDGGSNYFRCLAKNWDNFLRLDDLGNIIVPTIKNILKETNESIEPIEDKPKEPPTRKEMMEALASMIKSYEDLPPHALTNYITHYDLLSSLILVESLFKSLDCKPEI